MSAFSTLKSNRVTIQFGTYFLRVFEAYLKCFVWCLELALTNIFKLVSRQHLISIPGKDLRREKRCPEIIEPEHDDTQCGFRPGTANRIFTQHFREILGVCPRCLHMFCRPWESIRADSSWKSLESVTRVRCWRPPVTGRQVTVFLLRSLCPCR